MNRIGSTCFTTMLFLAIGGTSWAGPRYDQCVKGFPRVVNRVTRCRVGQANYDCPCPANTVRRPLGGRWAVCERQARPRLGGPFGVAPRLFRLARPMRPRLMLGAPLVAPRIRPWQRELRGKVRMDNMRGMCLHFQSRRARSGNRVNMRECSWRSAREQTFVYTSDGRIRLARNLHYCLHNWWGRPVDGNRVDLYRCDARAATSQRWFYTKDGQVQLLQDRRFCLTAPFPVQNGSRLLLKRCDRRLWCNQKWNLR